MGITVKVSLEQPIINPLICVVCGSKNNLYPRGHAILASTNHEIINYRGIFYFPVCEDCASKRGNIWQKRKRFRTKEEKEFLKMYDQYAVSCRLRYRPLLGIKVAIFTFNLYEFGEKFKRINNDALK